MVNFGWAILDGQFWMVNFGWSILILAKNAFLQITRIKNYLKLIPIFVKKSFTFCMYHVSMYPACLCPVFCISASCITVICISVSCTYMYLCLRVSLWIPVSCICIMYPCIPIPLYLCIPVFFILYL